MLLRIDSTRLRYLLEQRRERIGFGHRETHLTAVAEGLFLILTACTTSMGVWWRLGFIAMAVAVTVYAVVSTIITWSKGYNAGNLYRELIDLDRTEIRSSIIAVNDGNRYLLYHDTGWDCDFFPNHATRDDESENLRTLAEYLSRGFDIPQSDFTLTRVGGESHEKWSVEHHETRFYDYVLYKADITRVPETWKTDRFHVDSKDCRWMTVDEMLADPRIREINADVVGMVKARL